MACGYPFRCNTCGFAFQAWDEGDPYYRDENGKKRHAYHPDPKAMECTGVDSLHLCLDCGSLFSVDSNRPRRSCRRCKSRRIIDALRADRTPCPKCKRGVIRQKPDEILIS